MILYASLHRHRMFIVKFHLDSPILQRALARAPATTVQYEEQYQTSDGITLLFWAEGGDHTAFERGLTTDPTVTNLVQLAETQERRLYRVNFTPTGEEVATFPEWRELDISLLDATATYEHWDVQMRVPDRDALHQYREACTERVLDFRLKAIYEESAETKAGTQLTDCQRTTLTTARELGYFEIPRRASLADVADQCGVSSQAASERLRRGTATLVDMVL